MKAKIGLKMGRYTVDEIKHIHNKDPDWLANVVFFDYNSLFSERDGQLEFTHDKSSFEVDSQVRLWITVNAENDEEGERKAEMIAAALKKASLENRYDQIVYGPEAFSTCDNLKKNLPCESEESTKPEPVKKVFVRKVDSPSSSVIASSNKPQQTETVKDPLTFGTPFVAVSETKGDGEKLEARKREVEQPHVSEKITSKQMSNLHQPKPSDRLRRSFLLWLVSAGFPTSWVRYKNIELSIVQPEPSLIEKFNNIFLRAYGFDGYNAVNENITSADGKTKLYSGTMLPFWLMVASFLGLPSRPESVVEGVPQFSGWQLLRNLFGVWIPVKETLTSQDGDLSFYQYRWTEKKIVQGLLLFFKLTLVFPIKLFLMPFKIMLNCVKLVTEVLLPLISFYTAKYNAELLRGLIRSISNLTKNSILRAILISVGTIPLVAIAIIQYATVWARRIGLALTSPEKSARLAFALGYSLIIGEEGSIGQKFISNLMGGLGVIVSLALSAVLWTITLPLAVGALVTAIPPLLGAVTWISHLPFVVSSLTWLSQWPLLTNLMVLVNSAIGTVSAGLTLVFGPAITTLATAMSIQIPAAVMAVGTVLGMIAIPVAAILSRVADVLSNLWVSWVEQKPFTSLGRWISSSFMDNKNTKSLERGSVPKTVFVYQALAGSELIVSPCALHLEYKNISVLKAVEVTGDKAEAFYLRAKENKECGLIYEGARFPTPLESNATENSPATVF